jgi:hypothetical protein
VPALVVGRALLALVIVDNALAAPDTARAAE